MYETLWPLHRRDKNIMASDITEDTNFLSILLSLTRKTSLLAVCDGNPPVIPLTKGQLCGKLFQVMRHTIQHTLSWFLDCPFNRSRLSI